MNCDSQDTKDNNWKKQTLSNQTNIIISHYMYIASSLTIGERYPFYRLYIRPTSAISAISHLLYTPGLSLHPKWYKRKIAY